MRAQEEMPTVPHLVQQLIDLGMSPGDIAEALENRVSGRTIYRWAKGDSTPGNKSDYEALVELVRARSQ